MTTIYPFHEYAGLFPMMDGAEFNELKDSIAQNSQREPIILYENQILDGRNRYRACMELGIPPKFTNISAEEERDPLAIVIDLNLNRRHLSESQRAMVAAKIANLPRGRPTSKGPTLEIAAERMNTSRNSVVRAKKVLSQGTEKLQRAVESGAIPVTQAATYTKYEKEMQDRLVDRVISGDKPVEAARKVRAEVMRSAGNVEGKYRIIYADPPWKYGDTRDGLQGYSAAVDHYPAMSIEELCQLPVRDMAEENAVLFLWTTSPLLFECYPVIQEWGFKYKASIVWDKVAHNVGHYVSVRHEFLLICTRGSCLPDTNKLTDSVISIPKSREHSRKPEDFRALIDSMYTHGERIELFRRGGVPEGWAIWGNEAEEGEQCSNMG